MDFDAFYKELEKELVSLVEKRFKKHTRAALSDMEEYLRMSKGHLQDYARLLEVKKITPEEKRFLVEGLKQNAILYAMKEEGRSIMTMKRFSGSVITTTLEVLLAFAVKEIL